MKKKVLMITLVVAMMSIIFTGCSKTEAPVDDNKPADVGQEIDDNLVEGLYLTKTEVSEHGNFAMATMEIKDGKVLNFDYNEYLVDSGEAKNESNYAYAEGIAVIKI